MRLSIGPLSIGPRDPISPAALQRVLPVAGISDCQ
jgi:hypothetical protein